MTKNIFINKGFSLIETFVAITILMIVITGPLSIISKFFADNTFSKNQIIAAFLAQEGAEMISNYILNSACLEGASSVELCLDGKVCDINSHSSTFGHVSGGTITGIAECSSTDGVCRGPMYRESASAGPGYYLPYWVGPKSGNNVATEFYRGISIAKVDKNNYDELSLEPGDNLYIYKIVSKVKWSGRGKDSVNTSETFIVKNCFSNPI